MEDTEHLMNMMVICFLFYGLNRKQDLVAFDYLKHMLSSISNCLQYPIKTEYELYVLISRQNSTINPICFSSGIK